MVLRVEEVLRVAKVGSKRTPSHPVFCSEVQEGRKGSERRLYPQIKEQWPRHEAARVKQCFKPVVELKLVA